MLDEGTGPILSLWQASAFVVLLIACANIANLHARARRGTAARDRRAGSRSARAAARVVRELLTESMLLALIAVPPALGFAWICLHVMRISMPARILRFVPGIRDARARTCGCSAFTSGSRC